MAETRQQVTLRKIRNGLRKQAAVIQHEKEKIWEILKQDPAPKWKFVELSNNGVGYYYSPYVPIIKKVSSYPILLTGNEVFIGETK